LASESERDRYFVKAKGGSGLTDFEIAADSEEEAIAKAEKLTGSKDVSVVLVKKAKGAGPKRKGFLETLAALMRAFLDDPDRRIRKKVRKKTRQKPRKKSA